MLVFTKDLMFYLKKIGNKQENREILYILSSELFIVKVIQGMKSGLRSPLLA